MKPHWAIIAHLVLLALSWSKAEPELFLGASGGERHLFQEEDPDDDLLFSRAKTMLTEHLSTAPYAGVVEVTHLDECVEYFDNVFPKDCDPEDLATADLKACCRAGRHFVDDGSCLCELQIARGMLAEGSQGLVSLAGFCGITFPIPEDPVQFIENPSGVPECQPFEDGQINGRLTPEFLGMSPENLEATAPEDLPTFGDLYEAPSPGPFHVNYGILDVPRPQPSILLNAKSNELDFKALVVYPVDDNPLEETQQGLKRREGQPVSSQGPFPVLVFSPGFEVSPNNHFRTFHHLASQGVIVVSQYSTESIVTDFSEGTSRAWVNDIVYSLAHVVDLGAQAGSWAHGGVDADRLAVGGHSMGGGLSMLAAVVAREEYGLNVGVSMHVSPACKFRGRECDLATEGASRLADVEVLFICGDMDGVEKLAYAEFFQSQLPDGTASELVVLEGATHCLWEDDPVRWRGILECGKGTKSPFDAIREMQDAMLEFLGARGFVGAAGEVPEREEQSESQGEETGEEETEDEDSEEEEAEQGNAEPEGVGSAESDQAEEPEQQGTVPEGRPKTGKGRKKEGRKSEEPEQEEAEMGQPQQEEVSAEGPPARRPDVDGPAEPAQEQAEGDEGEAEVTGPEGAGATAEGPPKRAKGAKKAADLGEDETVEDESTEQEEEEVQQEGTTPAGPAKRRTGASNEDTSESEIGKKEEGEAEQEPAAPVRPPKRGKKAKRSAGAEQEGEGEGEAEQEQEAPESPPRRGEGANQADQAEQEGEQEEPEPQEAGPTSTQKKGKKAIATIEVEQEDEEQGNAEQLEPEQEDPEEDEPEDEGSTPKGKGKKSKKAKKSKGAKSEEAEAGDPEQEEVEQGEAEQEAMPPKKHKKMGKRAKKAAEAEQGGEAQGEAEQDDSEQDMDEQGAEVQEQATAMTPKKRAKNAE